MNVFFDHQIFSLQDYGGISRYFAELINGINQTGQHHAHLSSLLSNNIYLEELNIKKRSPVARWNVPRREPLLYHINQAYSLAQLRTRSFDIFHATYYDPYFVPYLKKGKPSVVTFLDMIHEKFAPQYPELALDRDVLQQKKTIINQADRLIAISQSTKNDMVELFDVDPSRVDVIYLGSSMPELDHEQSVNPVREQDDPYLLYIGSRHLYKNFTLFIRAVAPVLKQYGIRLVCGGGGSFTSEEHRLIAELGIAERVSQQPVNDQALRQLYENAYAFIFPSLYEGFGIPVLEAFACHCPCIISTGGSLPEVAGEAAVYFDPAEEQSIAEAVRSVLDNTELRDRLIVQGRHQLRLFSWQQTVSETIDLYKSLL